MRIIHAGPQVRLVRQHERQRRDDVRRDRQQHFAFGERLGDQPELVVLEVAQPAMDQLGALRRSGRGEIVLFGQQHGKAAARGVARDAGAVDAAADDEEVEDGRHEHASLGPARDFSGCAYA